MFLGYRTITISFFVQKIWFSIVCGRGCYTKDENATDIVVEQEIRDLRLIKYSQLNDHCCEPATAFMKTEGRTLDADFCEGMFASQTMSPGTEYETMVDICQTQCHLSYQDWLSGYITSDKRCLSASIDLKEETGEVFCHMKKTSSKETGGYCKKMANAKYSKSMLMELDPACRIDDSDLEHYSPCASRFPLSCITHTVPFMSTIYLKCDDEHTAPYIDSAFISSPMKENRRVKREEEAKFLSCPYVHIHELLNYYMFTETTIIETGFWLHHMLPSQWDNKVYKLKLEDAFRMLCGNEWYQTHADGGSTIFLNHHCELPRLNAEPRPQPMCDTHGLTLYFLD